MASSYHEIEKKWKKAWYSNNLYAASNKSSKQKKYILTEFPFPSGASLHVGHGFRFTVPDIYSRFLRMKGYNVMFPMGWDAFGLPTEEFARKTGANPKDVTKENINTLKTDLQGMGYGFDWDREVNTTDPKYYKWTQWIFTQLYKAGLAEQSEIELWWCENLATVLANEEVLDDENGNKISERGSHPVIKKKMKQWVLKMPVYGDKLLDGLEEINFPEHIKEMQKNWIGKSEGVVVDWEVVE
jgi:leucyl-tRNA synthetase